MRKIWLAALIILPVCTLFAQTRRDYITFNGYAFAAFEPLQMVKFDGKDPEFSAGIGSTGDEPHLELRINFNTPSRVFGGNLEFIHSTNNLYPQVNNNAVIWARPFNWIQLHLGRFQIDTLRGEVGTSDFARYLGPQGGSDDTFQRFHARRSGALLSIMPTENLFIGIMVNADIAVRYDSYSDNNYQDAGTIYRNGQYAISYTFPNFGKISFQYIGGESRVQPDSDKANYMNIYNHYRLENPMSFQAAFTLTAVNNLHLELGLLFPLRAKEGNYLLERPFGVGLGAELTFGNFNFEGRADVLFKEREKRQMDNELGPIVELTRNFTISARLTPSYSFSFATLGMDFLAYYQTSQKCDDSTYIFDNDKLHLGAAIWGHKRFGGGSIKVGLTFAMPTKWQTENDIPNKTFKTIKAPFVFTIPIIISFYI